MKFSIIVPVYFYDKFVELMFLSLEKQTFKNFEIVVVGNGISSEEFIEIGKSIKDVFSNSIINLKLIHTNLKGANSSRQFGYENSVGEYVFFLDSDDQLSDENVLDEINQLILTNEIDIISVNLQHANLRNNEVQLNKVVYDFLTKNEILHIDSHKDIILSNYGTNICARFIKRDLLSNILFLKLPYCQDWNVSSKLFLKARIFYFYQKPCYLWVFRENSISKIESMSLEKHLDSFNSIIDILEFYKKNDRNDDYRYFVNDRLVKFCFQYVGRSSYFDINEGFSRSKSLFKKELKFKSSFFKNKRIILMYLMIRFSFLYKLYFKFSAKLD